MDQTPEQPPQPSLRVGDDTITVAQAQARRVALEVAIDTTKETLRVSQIADIELNKQLEGLRRHVRFIEAQLAEGYAFRVDCERNLQTYERDLAQVLEATAS